MIEREENPDMNARIKKYGRETYSVWICNKCKYEMDSFLHNFEYHIPLNHEECGGEMIEDESRRESPQAPSLQDAGRERNWLKTASQEEQVRVLSSDDATPY